MLALKNVAAKPVPLLVEPPAGNAEERKQQLLDCAAELFSTRGYAATRIADICAAAGVAKGLFYWYFENKEALFAELVASMRQRLRKAQADAMDPAADALSRLRQGSEASVRFMARHAGYFALLEVESHDRQVSALLRQVHFRLFPFTALNGDADVVDCGANHDKQDRHRDHKFDQGEAPRLRNRHARRRKRP